MHMLTSGPGLTRAYACQWASLRTHSIQNIYRNDCVWTLVLIEHSVALSLRSLWIHVSPIKQVYLCQTAVLFQLVSRPKSIGRQICSSMPFAAA